MRIHKVIIMRSSPPLCDFESTQVGSRINVCIRKRKVFTPWNNCRSLRDIEWVIFVSYVYITEEVTGKFKRWRSEYC